MHKHTCERLEPRHLLAASHFAVIGDFGDGDQDELDVANLVKSWNPDYILTVGDNSYPDSSEPYLDNHVGQFYHEYIYNYHGAYGAGSPTRRFYPALGNHDWGSSFPNGDASHYLDYFDLPGNERYYDFAHGPVHVFVVDSDTNEPDGTTPDSIQGQWLKAGLAAATEPHKIVVMHHPPHNSGFLHGSEVRMRWPVAKWGATAVFTGHEHTYERFHAQGIPFFVNGLGGRDFRQFGPILAGSEKTFTDDFGAMRVDATDTSIRYRFYSRDGTLVDDLTVDQHLHKPLIQAGSNWKYLDNGSNQGTAWRQPAFDDSLWSTGGGQFGYGEGDEDTVIDFGDPSNKRITSYFRKTFNVPDPSLISALKLSLLRDDGAAVYLNGTPLFTNNLPASGFDYSTTALTNIGGSDEGDWHLSGINPALLVPGNNVLAVEMHQFAATSTDLSFDLTLLATGDFAPPSVASSSFKYQTGTSLEFNFSKRLAQTITSADLVLQNLTTGTTVSAGDIQIAWSNAGQTLVVTFLGGKAIADGRYAVTLSKSKINDTWGTASGSDLSHSFFFLNGDANRDGRVDVADLLPLTNHWLVASNTTYGAGDFNYDGVIDRLDLGILSSNWNKELPPAPAAAPVVDPAPQPAKPAKPAKPTRPAQKPTRS